MRSIELFAGAGGLALGTSRAGFVHELVVERDQDTCLTLRTNQQRGLQPVVAWSIVDQDVCSIDYSQIPSEVDLIAGGPPCQPFSLGGKHRGYNDVRDMFPEAVRAVRELRPRAFLFENVKGLTRATFAQYFSYIHLQLTYPELIRRPDEAWIDHLARLEQHHTRGYDAGLSYRVVSRLVNAADYGVAQRRERVFIVGFRSDVHQAWSFPEPTHAYEALLYQQWVTQNYWEQHRVARKDRPSPPDRLAPRLARLRIDTTLSYAPWRTIRDVIGDLPDPGDDQSSAWLNHDYRAGARVYKGHTGSPFDEPAKALKAGDHGVPGGENMLVKQDGSVRYFTVRESARIQGFPDTYYFPVSWTESMRQLGNAVPVDLGFAVAQRIFHTLKQTP